MVTKLQGPGHRPSIPNGSVSILTSEGTARNNACSKTALQLNPTLIDSVFLPTSRLLFYSSSLSNHLLHFSMAPDGTVNRGL